MTAEEFRAELLYIDRLTLAALRLGFHDDVRHWRAVRAELVAKSRERDWW